MPLILLAAAKFVGLAFSNFSRSSLDNSVKYLISTMLQKTSCTHVVVHDKGNLQVFQFADLFCMIEYLLLVWISILNKNDLLLRCLPGGYHLQIRPVQAK